MAELLITPKNKIYDVDDSGYSNAKIEWIITEPQDWFEVQYRLPTDIEWRTAGRVYSSSQTYYNVSNIYDILQTDFYEIYYRVIVHYNGTNGLGTIQGQETSPVYSLLFRHGIKGTLKLYDGIGTREFPLYDEVRTNSTYNLNNNVTEGKVAISDSNIKKYPLVQPDNATISDLNINIDSGTTKSVAYSYANWTNSEGYKYSEMYQTGSVQYLPVIGQRYAAIYSQTSSSAQKSYYEQKSLYAYNTGLVDYTIYTYVADSYSNLKRYCDPPVLTSYTPSIYLPTGYNSSSYYYCTLYGDTWGTTSYRAASAGEFVYYLSFSLDYDSYVNSGAKGITKYYNAYGHSEAVSTFFYDNGSTIDRYATKINAYIDTGTNNYTYNVRYIYTRSTDSYVGAYTYYTINTNFGYTYDELKSYTYDQYLYKASVPMLNISYTRKYAGIYRNYSTGSLTYSGYYIIEANNYTSYYNLTYFRRAYGYYYETKYGTGAIEGPFNSLAYYNDYGYYQQSGIQYIESSKYNPSTEEHVSFYRPNIVSYNYTSGATSYYAGIAPEYYDKYVRVSHQYCTRSYLYTATRGQIIPIHSWTTMSGQYQSVDNIYATGYVFAGYDFRPDTYGAGYTYYTTELISMKTQEICSGKKIGTTADRYSYITKKFDEMIGSNLNDHITTYYQRDNLLYNYITGNTGYTNFAYTYIND